MFCLFRVSRCLYLLSAQKNKKTTLVGARKLHLRSIHPSIYPPIQLSIRAYSFRHRPSIHYLPLPLFPPTTTIVTTDSCGQLPLGVPAVETISKYDICNDSQLMIDEPRTTSARTRQIYNQKLWLLIIIL